MPSQLLKPEVVPALGGFMAFGLSWGAWSAVLPAVQVSSGSTNGELGSALLMIGLGALLSMRLTGRLVDRFGGRVLPVVMTVFAIAGVLPGFAGSPVALAAALLLLGAVAGATDVAINAAGVRAEILLQRPVMNLAHACFSACVVVASLATAALRAAGVGPRLVLGAMSVLVVLITVVALLPGAACDNGPRGATPTGGDCSTLRRGGRTWRPAPPLIVFGCLCALAYFVEDAWQSWGAVHMETTLNAGAAVSSAAPAVFAAAAASGRFAGNGLARLVDPIRLLCAGALTASGGTLVAALVGIPWIGLVGIAVAGLGTSVCAPTVISLAGVWAGPERRGAAIATVTMIAYLGFLVGPAVVGVVSLLASLPAALAGVAAVAVLLAALAPTARRAASSPVASPQGRDRHRPGVEMPADWHRVGKEGTKDECSAFVEGVDGHAAARPARADEPRRPRLIGWGSR
jgi:MFS family permease